MRTDRLLNVMRRDILPSLKLRIWTVRSRIRENSVAAVIAGPPETPPNSHESGYSQLQRLPLMVWSLLTAALGAVRAGEPVTLELARDGRPAATIVLAEKPTRAAQLAVAELQEHVRLISGATLPIMNDAAEVQGPLILVGESKATQALGLKNADFKPQEYLVRFAPDLLVLMGRDKEDYEKLDYANPDGKTIPDLFDDHATCYAVYVPPRSIAGTTGRCL